MGSLEDTRYYIRRV